MIRLLSKDFLGKGSVKGDHFIQLERTEEKALYERTSSEGNKCYEVFKVKVASFKEMVNNDVYGSY